MTVSERIRANDWLFSASSHVTQASRGPAFSRSGFEAGRHASFLQPLVG